MSVVTQHSEVIATSQSSRAARTAVIHGLRRSGTTILWETLRSDAKLRCYDEPFHPRLAAGARDNHKGTWTELATDLKDRPAPVAIPPLAELTPGATAEEQDWLAALGTGADRVVIDIVRGWNRLPQLHAGLDRTVAVHLVRDPAGWAAAHLLPSGRPTTFARRLGNVWRKASFFRRRGGYDGYHYERIIRAALDEGHPVFHHVSRSPAELRRAPAYVQLLAFWWGANVTMARGLASLGKPMVTVTLGEFAGDPAREIGRIAKAAEWHDLAVSTERVRPLQPAHGSRDPRWADAAAWLDLPDDLFASGGCSAANLECAFARAGEAQA